MHIIIERVRRKALPGRETIIMKKEKVNGKPDTLRITNHRQALYSKQVLLSRFYSLIEKHKSAIRNGGAEEKAE